MNSKKQLEQSKGFEEFVRLPPVAPPQSLYESVYSKIKKDLNPSVWQVFAKLAAIHFVTSLVTLSLCPQFGFRLIGDSMGLMQFFMGLGAYGCMMACGFFFLGASLLAASLILRPEEIRVLRKNKFYGLSALAFLSLGFFLMNDAQMVLGVVMAWFLGSLLGGLALLEAGWAYRRRGYA